MGDADGIPPGVESGTRDDGHDTAATLIALTRLVSLWSTIDYQQSIAAASHVRLDPSAVRALYVLGREGGTATPSQVAAELRLSRPSTSKILGRLSDAGLMQRAPSTRDRRSVSVSLTPLGESRFAELFGAGISMIDTATAAWDPADRRALNQLLPRLITSLISTPPQ